ncbi:MAG: response regulator [Rhodobacterales bacterium]
MTQDFGQMRAPVANFGPVQNRSLLRKLYRPFRLGTPGPDHEKTADKNQAGIAADQPEEVVAEAPRRPLRVVIVEDEAIIAMELEMILAELGVDVVGVAMSADEAEALVAEQRPDCVTMDINIQGARDGVEAARAIFGKYGIRSVFVSAYGNEEARMRAADVQPIGWVMKPVETEQLDQMLRRVAQDET